MEVLMQGTTLLSLPSSQRPVTERCLLCSQTKPFNCSPLLLILLPVVPRKVGCSLWPEFLTEAMVIPGLWHRAVFYLFWVQTALSAWHPLWSENQCIEKGFIQPSLPFKNLPVFTFSLLNTQAKKNLWSKCGCSPQNSGVFFMSHFPP